MWGMWRCRSDGVEPKRSRSRMEQTPKEEGQEMPLESGPSEKPTCPNCSQPLTDSESELESWTFMEARMTCRNCGERVRITVKRLYIVEAMLERETQ